MKYTELAELYQILENTPKRLLKTKAIATLLKKVPTEDLPQFIFLLRGNIFKSGSEQKIGMAAKLVSKAIALATGKTANDVETSWKKTGDLGVTAEQLLKKKQQHTLSQSSLSVKKVFDNLHKIAETEGEGSVDRKIKLTAELLTSANPLEGKYIIRTVLEDLRVGIGEGSLRDAVVWAFFDKELGIVLDEEKLKIDFIHGSREEYAEYATLIQHAYDMSNDFGAVAQAAKEKGKKGLEEVHLTTGEPIKVMLYQKAKDMEDAFSIVGKPAAVEYKYDGFRMQIHKKGKEVFVYTRRLENVTKQFPEIAELVKENVNADDLILDCEAVGIDFKTKKYLPFQQISQRIKRKYNIQEVADKFPIEVNVFDILEYNNKNMLHEPFEKRRNIIEKIVNPVKTKFVVAKQLITEDVKKAKSFYEEALKMGVEGVMVKSLTAGYKPGSRVGYGVKVKPTMDPLDLVIIAAEWGTGKRKGWLTSFTLACRDEDANYVAIGKVGTGFKEKEDDMAGEVVENKSEDTKESVTFETMTDLLKPLIIKEKGREVFLKPKIVIEVAYEEIQKSPSYESGYALRFPRILRIRDDKPIDEVAYLSEVEDYYYEQKKG